MTSQSPSTIIIRPYQDKDIHTVQDLIAEVQNHERSLDPLRTAGELIRESQLARILRPVQEGTGMVLVAETGGRVVGYIAAHKQIDEMDAYERVYVADLGVNKAYRGKGIGTLLITEVERQAKEVFHVQYLRIGVLSPNIDAYRLYKRLGFQDQEIEMQKKI